MGENVPFLSVNRYLNGLKTYVCNKSCPEESIAEGYCAEECLTFCARYLHGVETRGNRSSRINDDDGYKSCEGLSVFSLKYCPISKKNDKQADDCLREQAHRYVLFNWDEIGVYIE